MDPVSIGLGKEVQGSMEALRNFLGPQDGNILGKILIQLTPDLQNRKRGSRFEADGLAGGMTPGSVRAAQKSSISSPVIRQSVPVSLPEMVPEGSFFPGCCQP